MSHMCILFAWLCLTCTSVVAYSPIPVQSLHGSLVSDNARAKLRSVLLDAVRRKTMLMGAKAVSEFEIGEGVVATIEKIAPFGAFCDVGAQVSALLLIDQNHELKVGDTCETTVTKLDLSPGQIQLKRRIVTPSPAEAPKVVETAPSAPPVSSASTSDSVEKRMDGIQAFTKEEFQKYYRDMGVDWQARWDAAAPAPSPAEPAAAYGPPLKSMAELQVGEEVDARVTNIAAFGVFCDIGAAQDGLLHVSEAGEGYIADLNSAYEVGQQFKARIKEIDQARNRISLCIKKESQVKSILRLNELEVGQEFPDAKIVSVADFGCFVDIGATSNGLLHISQAADTYVQERALYKAGDKVKVRVIAVDLVANRVSLSARDEARIAAERAARTQLQDVEIGSVVEGKVKTLASIGMFLDINARADAFLHMKEAADVTVTDMFMAFQEGDKLTCKILDVDMMAPRITVTAKGMGNPPPTHGIAST